MLFSRHSHQSGDHDAQTGRLLDRGWRYDAEVWLFDTFVMRGQIGQLRRDVLDRADLGSGNRMLDVGCGTGTLAIQAAGRVGAYGSVAGIDPAPRQIARAQTKARRARHTIDFRQARIENLPFADHSFDAVTSTLMMHHLPGDLKNRGLAEIRRVLKPGGRLVVADFDTAAEPGHSPDGNDRNPGDDNLADQIARAGFTHITTARTNFAKTHHGWSGATITSAANPSGLS